MDERLQTATEEATNRLRVDIFRGLHWRDCGDHRFSGKAAAFSRLLLVERTAAGGGGWIRSGSAVHRLRPGRAYLIPAGIPFALGYRRGLEMYSAFLRMSDAFGGDLLGRLGKVLERPLEPGVAAEIARLAERRRSIGDALRFRALLLAAVAPLLDLDLAEAGRRSRLAQAFASMLAELEGLPPARATIGLLAGRLGEKPENLSKRFRRATGMALRTFLQDRLRVHLATALSESDESVAAIAERLGFSDQFYCSRCCRRLLGVPPRAYRSQLAWPDPEHR